MPMPGSAWGKLLRAFLSVERLPVHEIAKSLGRTLERSGRAVLSAPPGSGKTTVLPLQLIEEPWLTGSILMLEPRRLAARAAASRMARLCGEAVGRRIGYQVRLDRRVSKETRIEVVTEGILTRRLQRDPELKGIGLVIFDEFHERGLQADLALTLCLDVASGLREDLHLLVMSATLDTSAVATMLGGAPVITAEGRSHPVAVHYLDRNPRDRDIPRMVSAGVFRALAREAGDILVFLPGVGEIHTVERLLSQRLEPGVLVCPLYGNLDSAAQDRAILPDPEGRRRVVLATSIAETSLTIEGVGCVVDSGFSRLPAFDPNTGLTRLETIRVSAASAEQRSGRAGRLGPGACHRLWTRATQAGLRAHSPAEILDADLSSLVLELALWGVSEAAQLHWLSPPPAGAFAQARGLLQTLGALDGSGRITPAGKRMAAIPVHPRLAHMMDRARASGQLELAADLAALVTERDIFSKIRGETLPVDIEDRLALISRWRRHGNRSIAGAGASPLACARLTRISRQLRGSFDGARGTPGEVMSVGALLAHAYPDRVAQRRGTDAGAYLMSSGRGVRLPPGDLLTGSEYLVAASLDAGVKEGRVFLASSIDLEQIRHILGIRIKTEPVIAWECGSQSVVTREEERLGALVLASRPLTEPDPMLVCRAMMDGVRSLGLGVLPWGREAEAWRTRLLSLRHWQPGSDWPDLSDAGLLENLDDWLAPWLEGMTRRDHLKRLKLLDILQNRLGWDQRKRLDQLAPTHIQVPSGSRKHLSYQPGNPPVLKVKLQEMFGLTDTPTVCGGQVPVTLHLLSPAQRPVQVTQDLRGFWEHTYHQVRKELKGRYPKHYWPEDPWAAEATSRLRPDRIR